MASLHESLQGTSRNGRQEIALKLISAMHDGDPDAHDEFYKLTMDVINSQELPPDNPDRPQGVVFPAADSAEMIRVVPRTSGYLRAIGRVPMVETAIDAGTGSTAILALGAAVFHEKSEVIGCELDEGAVLCARAMVKVLGLDDRIAIRHSNVLTDKIPRADLGITETFNAGMLFEPGPEISRILSDRCRETIPAMAGVWAIDDDARMSLLEQTLLSGESLTDLYQYVGQVNFADDTKELSGQFTAVGSGERFPYVCIGYYDARGDVVIGPGGGSMITLPIPLERMWVEQAGSTVNFQYKLGSDLVNPPPRVWVEPPLTT